MSAGEASGDRLAAGLVREIRIQNPEWRVCGIGSRFMREAGLELLLDVTHTSAIGISESLRVLPSALAAIRQAKRLLKRVRPDVFVAVDCQGMNLILAKTARKFGARIVYFIPPQNFLWNDIRHGRKTAARVDLFLNIYTSGHDFYKALGGKSVYCGHPLLDIASREAREVRTTEGARGGAKRSGNRRKTVALIAGARKNELRRFIPLLAESAAHIRERCPHVRFITPVTGPEHEQELLEGFARRGIEVTALPGEGIFAQADAAVIKSGTMALEAAFALCPYAIFYRISALSWFIMARLWGLRKKIRYISLPNILSRKELAREFIQDEARPDSIAEEIIMFITDKKEAQKRAALLQSFCQEMARENRGAQSFDARSAHAGEPDAGRRAAARKLLSPSVRASRAISEFIAEEFKN